MLQTKRALSSDGRKVILSRSPYCYQYSILQIITRPQRYLGNGPLQAVAS